MASQSVLELSVNTGKWDAGIKKAKAALDNFTTASGGLQQALGKDSDKMQKFVQMMGSMESMAKTAKGKMNDYKSTIEQLTMQYNRMTEAQQKTIGQEYLNTIEQIKQKYHAVNEELQNMNRSLQQTPSVPSGEGGGKLSGMLQVFGGNMMTKAAGWALDFAGSMASAVQQGIELAKAGEGIRAAFERLGRGDILDGLRQATHGTVTDLELMKAAVKFNDFRLPLDELGTMLAFAQQKAKDTGQSVDYLVDSIVTGLGRQSLMILDNLGLSATEIKEKMAETGDMTKAVGEIIREQMAKAGDYVQTAADKTAKANAEVQNKMEELGRTFQPLAEAGSSMWNDLKISAMDFLQWGITPVIKGLQAIGVLRKNISNNDNNSNNNGQTTQEPPANQTRTLGTYTETTIDGKVVKATRDGKTLFDYTGRGGGGKSGGSGSVTEILPVGSVAQLNKEMQQLRDEQSKVTNPYAWQEYEDKIKAVTNQIKEMKGEIGIDALRGMESATIATAITPKQWDEDRKDFVKRGKERLDKFKAPETPKREEVKLTEVMGQMNSGISSMVSGIEGLGIELPKGFKDVLGGLQNVTSILTGIATIVSTIQAISTASLFKPMAFGGVARAAIGLSVPGSTFSGDMIPARLNAGETVLNQAQSGIIASALQDRELGMGGMAGQPYVDGEKIFLGTNNTLKRMGYGEIVTTSMLRRLGLM